MSREWSAESFTTHAATPVGFVPAGLLDQVAALAPHTLGEVAGRGRAGFVARDLSSWTKPEAFSLTPHPNVPAAPAAAEPFPAAPSAEEAFEPVVAAPAVDIDAVFAAGVSEGRRQSAAGVAADAQACAELIGRLGGAAMFDRAALATQLRETVLLLVRQLVGEVGIAGEMLASRVQEAVDMLADVTEPARLHLHPADLQLVTEHLAANIATVADPAMDRGGFRLETLSATVEDGPALWLDQLAGALDRIALPE